MKIILSRKGFDSDNGGCPSPIFPNDRLYSLPIPDTLATRNFDQIGRDGVGLAASAMGTAVADLTGGKVLGSHPAHLDPDLDASAIGRQTGWRPAFGQAQAAQGHLRKQQVGVGDVFLFYGWYRRVERFGERWRFVESAPDLHVVFGWLQVGEVIEVRPGSEQEVLKRLPWLNDHPHLHVPPESLSGKNVVYVANERLLLPGLESLGITGGGICSKFDSRRVLTAPNARLRSLWRLPKWFWLDGRMPRLSYHSDPTRWSTDGDRHMGLQTVGRGQEFVLDCEHRSEAARWIADVLADDSALHS